ncbi:MAG: hypothetical protein AB8G22_21450 [Saprospiraceae bacterium]
MNHIKLFLLCFTFFLVTGTYLNAQNCSGVIADDRKINGVHRLQTEVQTLVVRGNYSYSLELMSGAKGVIAKVYSKSGVEFNQGDEIIFMDANRTRRSYRFINMGELKREGATPVHINTLQMDLAAVKWFATNPINTIYIKNNISNQMRKFTVNASRQTEFQRLATCFNQNLDAESLKDVVLEGNRFAPGRALSSTGASSEK